jgi:hypothetical protein
MKKALTSLVIVVALLAGSVSFAGTGAPKTGGGRTNLDISSLDCTIMTVSALECQALSSLK